MNQYRIPAAILTLCLIFTTLFLYNTKRDFPLIFQKDLHAHDESSNAVVAANITRKFFPPVVRVNPLVEQQGNWMEGPFWQHIPPMFAYVPYIFFKLDGQITIEVKRLSYAFLIWLAGILFINLMYAYSKSLWGALAALIAVIFWISTPFTHELITGYAFGVSDIVLAFTAILALDGVLWYLHKEKEGRLNYPWWKIGIMAVFVSLPIMAKSLLGAIPAAIFLLSILFDHKVFSKKTLSAVSFFLGALAVYYLPLFFASPETFKSEILVSFFHAANYEGWGRSWHFYLTNYLPQRYLFGWTWVYFVGLLFATGYLYFAKLQRIQKLLIGIPLLWFVWNLLAISLVESKIPNFIFQSYLLSLFAIVFSLILFLRNHFERLAPASPKTASRGGRSLSEKGISHFANRYVRDGVILLMLIGSILVTGYEIVRFERQFKVQRAQAYNYQTEHEKLYQIAEQMRADGLNQNDLVIIHNLPNDCWERYYIMFLTGAESKTLLEMYFNTVPIETIASRYQRIYFLTDKPIQIRADQIPGLVVSHNSEIQSEILRIKKDKTSCQWLVPDAVLNAP